MTAAKRLPLVLAGLVIACALVEVAARLGLLPTDDLLPIRNYERRLKRLVSGDAYVRFDAQLGWAPTPGVSRTALGVTYRTNLAGMRAEREYDPTPPAGVVRFAAFGDSYTYCHEVSYRDCWTARLESARPGQEVLNFGVPGYGPDQAWLRYQREAGPYRACAVLIGYMAENVNRVVNRYRPFLTPDTDLLAGKPRFVLNGDRLELLPNAATDPELLSDPWWIERELGPGDRWFIPGTFTPRPLDGLYLARLARTVAYRAQHGDPDTQGMTDGYRERGEGYELANRILVEFAGSVWSDGATPVVLFFNPRTELQKALDGQTTAMASLIERIAAAGIPIVDLTPPLVEEARRTGLDPLVEFHYTPRANGIVARILAERLPALTAPTCGG